MDVIRSLPGTSALVLDSPHSGTTYPPDFGFVWDATLLRRAECTHAEKRYAFAADAGAAWIDAVFPRSYLDENCGLDEIDAPMFEPPRPAPASNDPRVRSTLQLVKGLIGRCTDEGVDIHRRLLSVEKGERRAVNCWRPYHDAAAAAVDAAHGRHGHRIHLFCHSMPVIAASHATDFPGLMHADFVVGDCDGSAVSPQFAELICERLRGCGHDVAYNHSYKAVELVRLYMNEVTMALNDGLASLRAHLRQLVDRLTGLERRAWLQQGSAR